MSIEAIDFPAAAQPIQHDMLERNSQPPATGFESWIGQQLNQMNDKLINAEKQVQQLAVGDVENLHQVMISLEEAKLSFQLSMQIRNKVLEAYQDVLRMQV